MSRVPASRQAARTLGLGWRLFGYGAAVVVMSAILYRVLVSQIFVPSLHHEEADRARTVVQEMVADRPFAAISSADVAAASRASGWAIRLQRTGESLTTARALSEFDRDPIALVDAPCQFVVPIREGDTVTGYAVVVPDHGGPPPLSHLAVLFLAVGIALGTASIFVARTLTRPLSRLAWTARRLGAGDLAVRARLERNDELGDVGRAFDRMADEITHLLRWQRQLLQNVSHELRTPLTRIRMAAEVAAQPDVRPSRDPLRTIEREVDELQGLVDDLLVAARLEAGSTRPEGGLPPLSYDAVDVGELLAQCGERFRATFRSHQLEIREYGAAMLMADAAMLKRLFDNLLDNAGKYSEPGSAVRVEVCCEPDALVVRVRDEGFGIAQDDLERLGSPFFRADPSRTRRTGGVGLGFLLALRIAQAHGGRIDVDSEPGIGTTVQVWLPRRAS